MALGNDNWGLSVAFSPDGRTLASAGKDRNVILWDIAERKPVCGFLRGHTAPPVTVAFSADGHSLLSLGQDNVALSWTSECLSSIARRLPTLDDLVSSVAFRGESSIVAAATAEHGIVLWDPDAWRRIGAPLRGQTEQILSLMFASPGDQLLLAAKSRFVEWRPNGAVMNASKLPGTTDPVSQVAFSRYGRFSAWSDGSVLLLRTPANSSPARLPIGLASDDHGPMALAFSPDGSRLASGGEDGTLASGT